ncbi:hypothetical protein COO91_04827 [Nostoc flagelliforme CCNUN1]|uniref:Uncharacterized protein n=1 Tax=Nostoc flagelliforme CCNUN1 TaxID=2038116 RepID=A0A2K8SU36_9NOSO|nr:hypothetical protein COO91_04827 [Nostoc flagelliforme CCNUN1]
MKKRQGGRGQGAREMENNGDLDLCQYLSGFGEKGKEKTFNLYPLTFFQTKFQFKT